MDKKIKSNRLRWVAWGLFILYLPILIEVIVLKGGPTLMLHLSAIRLQLSPHRAEILLTHRTPNFIPFKTIFYYMWGNQNFIISIENIAGNILAFCPLGFLLPILFAACKRLKNIFLISLAASLSIELVQLYFNIGSFDVDDLILNVLGALLGFGAYQVLKSLHASSK